MTQLFLLFAKKSTIFATVKNSYDRQLFSKLRISDCKEEFHDENQKNDMFFVQGKKTKNVNIRAITLNEYPLLDDFLYDAIFIPEGVAPPDRSITQLPELQKYIAHFGTQKDDYCLVAEVDGVLVGAVWARIIDDYGHVDDDTPSLSISVKAPYRQRGIGTALMQAMLTLLKTEGYKQVSLSVQKANYARKMYLKLGFEIVKTNEEDEIMVYKKEKGYE